MTHRVAAGALALTLLVGLSACTIDPAASGTTATPTLNPNQLDALRRSAGTSPTPQAIQPPSSVERTPDSTGSPSATSAPINTPVPTPYDGALEAMLPSSIRGIPLDRFSAPASMYATGGDICSYICPGEPARLASEAGVEVDDITVAIAYADQSSGLRVGILAFRLREVPTAELVGIRLREGGLVGSSGDYPPDTRSMEVGSHTVTRVTYGPVYMEDYGEYLLATDDVLFVVFGDPPSTAGTVPDDVRLAIEALP